MENKVAIVYGISGKVPVAGQQQFLKVSYLLASQSHSSIAQHLDKPANNNETKNINNINQSNMNTQSFTTTLLVD